MIGMAENGGTVRLRNGGCMGACLMMRPQYFSLMEVVDLSFAVTSEHH